jgi:hypothetical protein
MLPTCRRSRRASRDVVRGPSGPLVGTRTVRRPAFRAGAAALLVLSAITGVVTLQPGIAQAAPATHFSVAAPASVTKGVSFSFTVTALDQVNSTDTTFAGTVHFTSSDPAADLPADTVLISGTRTLSATINTTGNQTITATATGNAAVNGTSNTIVVTNPATKFVVSAPGSATAGSAFEFTVTAKDQFDNVASGYGGTVHLTSSDGEAALPADSTLTNGTGTFSATLKTAGSQTITATDSSVATISGASGAIAVGPGSATQFVVSAPASATAGSAFNVQVTARDEFGNVASGYAGTVHFTSTDGQAVLPIDSTLTNGTGTFSATLKTAGSRTITATDTVTGSITGTTSGIAVSPASTTHFTVSAPASTTAGTPFSFTVTARDQFGNAATGYAGTVDFSSTDGAAVLPPNSTLTNGTGTFPAVLNTPPSQTITATDTVTSSITGVSGSVIVGAVSATHFVVSAPVSATAGSAFNFTVTAKDAADNTVTNYSGTVHFTSSDDSAILPANATLTNGTGTFSATLKTAGSQTITATDVLVPLISGASGAIAVGPGSATQFVVSAPASATAGSAFNVQVTARDEFGNIASGYAGTVHFTSTDGQAVLPIDSTLTNGTGTFSATLKTAGSRTITATDTVTGSITGTSGGIAVNPAGATHLVVATPATASATVPFSFTVTAKDQFENTASNYGGTVHFTSNDPAATLPANSTLTNGVGSFAATLRTAGSDKTITGTDTVTGSINGTSDGITVGAAPATHFSVSAPTSAAAGVAFDFNVTALDQANNTATGYAGTIHVTSSDASATLPADSTLTDGVGTFSATLESLGNQTLAVADSTNAAVNGTSNTVAVGPGPTTHFEVIPASASQTAGTAFNFTVRAKDQFGNTAPGYAGTVHFTSTDGEAVLPIDSTLTNGTGTFSATLKTAGSKTITATDTVTGSITGTSAGITVAPDSTDHFAVTAPSSVAGGTSLSFTVTAQDQFDNTTPGYIGLLDFTSSDGAATLPSNSTLTNGTGTFSATLRTLGDQTITATDVVTSSITGTSASITVGAPTVHLVVSAPTSTTAGTPFNVTVTAKDPSDTTITDYSGTVHFTSSDGEAVLPADATLTNGTGTFPVTLKTAGPQTITGTDTVTASTTGSGSTTVSPAAASDFSVSAPPSTTAGSGFDFTVTAHDPYGNTVTDYAGVVHFTSSDDEATVPADSALTNGTGTFSATLETAGSQTITATEAITQSITGSSGAIDVAAASADHLELSVPTAASKGIPIDFTVTAVDQFGNTDPTYSGLVHLTSSDGAATLPPDTTLVDGTISLAATFHTTGNQTLTGTDTVTASITGTSAAIPVTLAPATHFSVSAPSSATIGSPFTFTVTALDQANNPATGYTGTVSLTSSDGAATLPADSTLTDGVGTFSATLRTAGSQTITATDSETASLTGTSNTIDVGPVTSHTVTRFGGADRIDTAVRLSVDTFADKAADSESASSQELSAELLQAGAAVIARSDDFADALAGAPLAVAKTAPLLLTPSSTLDSRVMDEIERILPAGETVYLLGGTAALSPAVATELTDAGYDVVRFAGSDRYGTATEIADEGLGNPTTLLLATGRNFPDALSAGAAAAKVGGAVLLTNGSSMPSATQSYLTAHPGATRVAIGAPAAAADPGALAIAGESRYETATLVADHFFSSPPVVGVASGERFPDASAGGAHAGNRGGPLLLVRRTSLPTVTADYLTANKASIATANLYGGTAVIAENVRAAVESALS